MDTNVIVAFGILGSYRMTWSIECGNFARVRQRRVCASTVAACVNSCRVRQQLPRAATEASQVDSR
jgi:hypothetical protein